MITCYHMHLHVPIVVASSLLSFIFMALQRSKLGICLNYLFPSCRSMNYPNTFGARSSRASIIPRIGFTVQR
ncbi:hypothetical protein VN97_g10068 [Penicillium thymicola]|uniref:Uncharacterized protein n=1 Tax=Penicillium thymicola TaxID=293382 RepID=A0AAI9TAG8_PENTH|nr:hypothetical protein VN97_g10068 [Penicillium thymicola]